MASIAMFSRAILTTVKRLFDRRLAQSDEVPCLSASISKTLRPSRLRQSATFWDSVDFPTPPFWLTNPQIMESTLVDSRFVQMYKKAYVGMWVTTNLSNQRVSPP